LSPFEKDCSASHQRRNPNNPVFEITEYDTLSTSFATDIYAQSQRVRRGVDSTCESQEQTFLSDIIGDKKKRIEEKVIPQIKLQVKMLCINVSRENQRHLQ
jgi:hypothetical protein